MYEFGEKVTYYVSKHQKYFVVRTLPRIIHANSEDNLSWVTSISHDLIEKL
jgi:hypothetical protein